MLPPEGDFLGINPLFRIRRFPSTSKQMATFTGELRPRLFMACSPTNLATLDYEKEEEALFRAIYGQDVAFDFALGTFLSILSFQLHLGNRDRLKLIRKWIRARSVRK